MDRESDPWETNENRPSLMIGDVSVSVLAPNRYNVHSPAGDEAIEGFEAARQRARKLAGLD